MSNDEPVSLIRFLLTSYFAYLSCILCKVTYIRIKNSIFAGTFKNFLINKRDSSIYYMITFYSKCEIKYDHCKLLINERLITPFQTVKPTIHIIRDGTIVDSYYESDLEPKFMLDKPYDFIIHEISNVVSKDCDTIYMTRLTSLTKESINRNVKLSNIKFVYISLNNNDEIIPIDFVPHNNYYIVGTGSTLRDRLKPYGIFMDFPYVKRDPLPSKNPMGTIRIPSCCGPAGRT